MFHTVWVRPAGHPTIPVPEVVCADGFTVSVQASEFAYCAPRVSGAPTYWSVEVGFPSSRPEPWSVWEQYAETPSDPTGTVYGWVPAGVVQALVESHGGQV